MNPRTVLFVDDDETFRKVLARELEHAGYRVHAFPDAETALAGATDADPDVALVDLRLPGMDGMDLLERLSAASPGLPIVLLTGHGAVPEAVAAMRRGAFDFLTKPAPLDRVEQCLERACRHRDLTRENARLRELVQRSDDGSGGTEILGSSALMHALRALIARVADSDANALIVGENGTGKELVAHRLHELSPRSEHPFVVVNCGAIAEDLIESELFGHERGAFTGAERKRTGLLEAAHGGTVFLDEIGELPLTTQPALLRAVQFGEIRPVGAHASRHVDVRVIAATNRDILREVEEGRFREDLYYRIAALVIEVPPLRERKGDVPELALYFLARINGRRPEEKRAELTPDALAKLTSYDWRGNVRELENAIVRLATLCPSPRIDAADVERHVQRRRVEGSGGLPTLYLDDLQRLAVVEALRRHEGNRGRAAVELGIAVKTLYNKIHSYAVQRSEYLQ
jgi:two-component system response regulator HydG